MSHSEQSNQPHNQSQSSNLHNQDEESAIRNLQVKSTSQTLTSEDSTPLSKDKSSGSFFNKSLFFGFALGFLFFWGRGQIFSRSHSSKPEQPGQEVNQKSSSAQKRVVTTTLAKDTLIRKVIEVTGTVESTDLVPVIAEVNGIPIREILVKEGAKVKRGQILAKLKDENLKTEYLEAKARVDQFTARLAELRLGTRSEEIKRAEQRVKSAKARLVVAKSDLDLANKRIAPNKDLAEQGAISRDRFDEVLNQAQNSLAQVKEAQANLDEVSQELEQLKSGNLPAVINQAKAELSQAQAQMQLAAVQVKNTQVKAVTDGVIAERNVQVGDVTSDSQTLFSIIENGNLELQLQVPETDLGKLKIGQEVEIGNNKNSFGVITSKIKSINPIVNSDSRQAIVKVDLPEKVSLKPGMFLNAAITIARSPGTIVPIQALLPQNDGKATIFVVQSDQTVQARTISLGKIIDNDHMEVLAGLQPDEQIILKGATYLKDGDLVSITPKLVESIK